jgi:type III restriction enzyme
MLYDNFNIRKEDYGDDFFTIKTDQKSEILKCLNPEFEIRPYQKEALGRFFFYVEEYHNKQKPIHLLFNMATGSGKTLIMAANILYLYKKGYTNFIFFTRLDNIIQKTRENFCNPLSKKYLFANKIVLDGKEVKITEVDNFDGVNDKDINIIFTTISNLHSKFNASREGAITFEDFADKKVVLIGDEAHNFSAETRNNGLTKEELEDKNSWERTIMGNSKDLFNTPGILNANLQKENILLEFTATARLENDYPEVVEKYKDKAIYRYDLKEYRLDGYSKEVSVLEADLDAIDRAIYAVLISQYRRKVAEKFKKGLKPVVLFKSQKISESEEFFQIFLNKIRNLKIKDLEEIKSDSDKLKNTEGGESVLARAFKYFTDNNIILDNLLAEIKNDFSEEKCIVVNSKSDFDEKKQILVNSLEDDNNEIRAIFAVDMLNEGWDVLNLFDIVRVNKGRDARANIPGKTTVREAQLIGRGARYWPFKINEEDEKYKRKFDEIKNEKDAELRVLEELYYHSQTNPKYIQELRTALKKTGIMADTARAVEVRVKKSIKKERFWKEGVIYLNEKKKNTRQKVNSLKDYNIQDIYLYHLGSKIGSESLLLGSDKVVVRETNSRVILFKELSEFLVRKAINKLPFFYFDNLQKYFPNLESIKDFMGSNKYLSGIKIEVKGDKDELYLLNEDKKLEIVIKVLDSISKDVVSNAFEYIGTKEFYPAKIKDTIKDKILKIENRDGGEQEYGRGMNETVNQEYRLNLNEKKWYVYNENYGTSEEKHFVKFINNVIDKLYKKYEEVYLVRNERTFQIYRFSDGSAMEPDFVLFLRKKGQKEYLTYQLFIEAKGGDRLTNEDSKWKEEFLLELEKDSKVELKDEDDKYKLIGMPLYNHSNEDVFMKKFENYL